ncbi:hypothetical protein AOL_s00007g549 [Orbilia oligospora ATCC 24927]|uniref:Uncharacterized protein n=1 Tax=Arthrobotrys oligospora (strain ATCC 24927 / CBS 115.81 / DSM 1491) TaxID=756982 RepID=G1X2N9_ARTOA|nr:hypothetical protein AOL_s00007g549 [Orbilia oligospora ATCC 24927]EGX52561.1 hypothetical protein AOL_s00007g549 [Orbilia oligospora ATCC 24927]
MELTTDGNHLADNQAIQEQYATGYSYNAAATVYMAKRYHAMEYEFNTGLPINPGLLPNFTTECPSSNCSSIDTPPYPPTTWSPSEPSVASLSSPYEVHLEKMGFAARTEYPLDDTDEVLQGLGLYDCPELATDCGSLDELCSSYLGLGKGLKLEESFEFKEYSDDEEDEEDEEEYDEN